MTDDLNLRQIIELMPWNVYWKDRNCILKGCNLGLAKTLGLNSPDEIIGKSDYDLGTKEEAEAIRKFDFMVMEQKKESYIEESYILPDGKTAFYMTKKHPLFDDHGEVVGLVGISIDITAEKLNQKYKLEKEKAEEAAEKSRLLAASIAHELRTPLSSINSYADGMRLYMPELIAAYQKAKEAGLPVAHFRRDELVALEESIDDIKQETNYTNVFINMLLMNLSQEHAIGRCLQVCTIKRCVDEALLRFPLTKSDKKLITTDIKSNFEFMGDELLTIHVLFNLLKNALHYVKAAGKGNITIETDTNGKYNYLYFTDTGTGIAASEINKVFERFYSKTRHGSGVGLSFCKMVMKSYNGDIRCESTEGEYTKFILQFDRLIGN